MSTGQVDRIVLFRLKAEADPASESVLREWGDRLAGVRVAADEKTLAHTRDTLSAERSMYEAHTRLLADQHADLIAARESKAEAAARREDERRRRDEEAEKRKSERLAQEAERAGERVAASQRSMADGFHMAAEGAVKLGQGFATLGLLAEEDLEALVRGLVQIKATVDLVRGGIEVWRGLSDGVRAYTATVEAATVAERSLAAARAASAGAGGLSVGAGAAGAAGASGAGSVAATASGALLAAIGSLPAAIAAAVAGTAAAGAMAFNIGGSRDYAANLMDPYVQPDSFLGHQLNRPMGGLAMANPVSFAISRFGPTGDLNAANEQSQQALSDAQQRAAAERAQADAVGRRADLQARADAQLRAMDQAAGVRAMDAELRSYGLEGNELAAESSRRLAGDAQRDIAAARSRVGSLSGQTATSAAGRAQLDSDLQAAQKQLSDAEERFAKYSDQRLQAERAISAERISAADQAIGKAQQEISLREQAIKAEQDRLLSAQERFGQLDSKEQQRLIDLQKRADRGETLSVEEYQALDRLGTRGTRRQASEAYVARAEAAGFSRVFGQEERGNVERLEGERQTFEASIKDQREFKIQLEKDDAKFAREIARDVAETLAKREARLREEIQRQVQIEVGKINQQMGQTAANRAVSFKR